MMHADQLPIDADTARAMVADQFPAYRDDPVVHLHTTGTDNAIFRVGTGLVARFPLHPMDPVVCANRLRDEAAAMTAFARAASCATPLPIGLGRPGPLYPMPWALQTWSRHPEGLRHSILSRATLSV